MSDEDDGQLGDTIARIASLPVADEAAPESREPASPEQYADTMTGKELAGIVSRINAEHQELEGQASDDPEPAVRDEAETAVPASESIPPDASVPDFDVYGAPPIPPPAIQVSNVPGDDAVMAEISSVVRVMEERLRARVQEILEARKLRMEADYKDKVQRLREVSRREMEMRESEIRAQLQETYRDKEQLLRSYYKKLIAVANKITRQKAQLQQARKQFESKLESANRLYREVDEMRTLLTENIGYLDKETEEVPAPPDSI